MMINIREKGDEFYSEVLEMEFKKFLGINHYSVFTLSGGISEYDRSEPKSLLQERIDLIRERIKTTNPEYVFLGFYETSQEFKENVRLGLEGILARTSRKWDEFQAKLLLPECEDVRRVGKILVRKYVPEA
jgi:hypothetical protein